MTRMNKAKNENEDEDKIVAYRIDLKASLRARFKAKCSLQQKDMKEVVTKLISDWVEEN
jgi:hypothetical protein